MQSCCMSLFKISLYLKRHLYMSVTFFSSPFFLFHTCSSFTKPKCNQHQSGASWGWHQLRQRRAESESAATGDVENRLQTADVVFFVILAHHHWFIRFFFPILTLQTPHASSKKSAPTTPVKANTVASPEKPLRPVTPRTAAPGESSETTDISESEENSPAVVRLINI